MAKSDRLLDFFPAFYRAGDRAKLLSQVVRSLTQPLEEADTHLFRIQRAHRIKMAEHADDIIRLAAVLNLTAFHFDDILADKGLGYDRKLDLMRERLQRIARVHLRGLGTPWAVMEGAAIFLNATIVPDPSGGPAIKHLDAGSFSHCAIIEFTNLTGKPRDRIYLHENPLRRSKAVPAERWQMNSWVVENRNVQVSPAKFLIQGVGDRTVLPCIFCPGTQEGFLFNGIIPEGGALVIDQVNGAELDGHPVDEWLVYFRGGVFDFAQAEGSTFVAEQSQAVTHFDGNPGDITSRPFRKKIPVPAVPIGSSQWHFKVAEGVYEGSDYDYSVLATHPDPVGVYGGDFNYDQTVFDYPAAAVVGMAWDERIPCAFKLMLPAHLPSATGKETSAARSPAANHVSRVGSLLPRFKAAGVRAYVDGGKDSWLLGESVIRSASAGDGEGVEFHAMRVQNQNADILVPLDAES